LAAQHGTEFFRQCPEFRFFRGPGKEGQGDGRGKGPGPGEAFFKQVPLKRTRDSRRVPVGEEDKEF
jgi:hypothetical protein